MSDNNTKKQFIGQQIKAARERKGLTQADLAKALGRSTGAISNYENGVSTVHLTDLRQLSQILEVSYEFLVDGHETKGLGLRFAPTSTEGYLAEVQEFLQATEYAHREGLTEVLKLVSDVSRLEQYLRNHADDDQQQEIRSLEGLLNQFATELIDLRRQLRDLGFEWEIFGIPPAGQEDQIG